ncbi:WXG100 family type VII secretion target [Streptomyces leeuwenhoekii]|uniref:WXG100 family type VII secretion target n=1 Tax=Streptomyces leeuwenhoekii TaxID=1437453 RepID=UPI003695EC94
MGVVLPDELAWVLDLIGIEWPNVDEDEFREMADDLRAFAEEVDDGRAGTHQAVQRLLSENSGVAIEAFQAHWNKVNSEHLANLGEGARLLANGLDGAATLIAGAKGAAIVQLGILAAEVAAAQAAAPITLGLSELGALGATQATRVVVRRILREAEQAAAEEIMALATGPVFAALGSMAGNLTVQLTAGALDPQDDVEWDQVGQAGKEGFSGGVDDAQARLGLFAGTDGDTHGGPPPPTPPLPPSPPRPPSVAGTGSPFG